MAIQALDTFRQKYPAYADRSDEELAGALADKYPNEYGILPEMVSREESVGGFNPKTQRSALMAKERANPWEAVGKEIMYNPMSDPKLNTLGKLKAQAIKMSMIPGIAKAIGAFGQQSESLASALPVAIQRGKDIPGTLRKAITMEEPTQLGDIPMNEGAPDWVSAGLGLAGSALLPGPAGAVKGVGVLREALGKAIVPARQKVLEGFAKAQLHALSGASPGAIKKGIEKGFSFIKTGKGATFVDDNLDTAVEKVRGAVDYAQERASRYVGKVMNKYAKKEVVAKGITDNTVNKLKASSLMLDTPEGLQLSRVRGIDNLKTIIDEVDAKIAKQGGKLSVEQIKFYKAGLKDLAKNPEFGAVYAAANEFSDDLSNLAGSAHESIKKANDFYSLTQKIIKKNAGEGTVGIDPLTKTSTRGATPIENYHKLPNKAQQAVEGLQEFTPKKPFLNSLQEAAAAKEFSSGMPNKSIGLVGGVGVISNPAAWPLIGALLGGSSPKGSALMWKRILTKKQGSPALDAVRGLLERGMIDPAIMQGARSKVLGQDSLSRDIEQY